MMRRLSILTLLLCALVGFVGTSSATAAEGEAGDFCSHSPDYPFGWSFNDACRGHDECLFDLPSGAPLPDRLGCDDAFFTDLLSSPHHAAQEVCQESALCSFLAGVYYRVVSSMTLLSGGAIDLGDLADMDDLTDLDSLREFALRTAGSG